MFCEVPTPSASTIAAFCLYVVRRGCDRLEFDYSRHGVIPGCFSGSDGLYCELMRVSYRTQAARQRRGGGASTLSYTSPTLTTCYAPKQSDRETGTGN